MGLITRLRGWWVFRARWWWRVRRGRCPLDPVKCPDVDEIEIRAVYRCDTPQSVLDAAKSGLNTDGSGLIRPEPSDSEAE